MENPESIYNLKKKSTRYNNMSNIWRCILYFATTSVSRYIFIEIFMFKLFSAHRSDLSIICFFELMNVL